MTERQRDAFIAACQAQGALQAATGAYTAADSLVNVALVRADCLAGINLYGSGMHGRTITALERGWAALREAQDEIGDLIAELKQGAQPPEPTDYSI